MRAVVATCAIVFLIGADLCPHVRSRNHFTNLTDALVDQFAMAEQLVKTLYMRL